MIDVKRIDHVAYVVPDIDAALAPFAVLGVLPGQREVVESQKTEAHRTSKLRIPRSRSRAARTTGP